MHKPAAANKTMNTLRILWITLLFCLLSAWLPLYAQEAGKSPGGSGLEVKIYLLGNVLFNRMPALPLNTKPNFIKETALPDLNGDVDKSAFYGLPEQSIYAQVNGYLNIAESKSYAFRLRSSDGAVLLLDGKEIISHTKPHAEADREAETHLLAGSHKLEIHYFKNKRLTGRRLALYWYNTSVKNWELIPAACFSYEKEAQETADGIKQTANERGKAPDVNAALSPGDQCPVAGLHPAYSVFTLHKASFQPKVGAMDFLPDGRLVLSTWDSLGQVFILSGTETADTDKIQVKRIALGLAEPLGLKVVNGRIFVLQKQELTELIDNDADEITDEYRTICNGWGATANYHEFAFGLLFKDNCFYATLAIAMQPGGRSLLPQNPDRGRVIKIALDGNYEFVASGLRAPNGLGIGPEDEIFISDNQGDWLPANKIVRLKPGAFYNNYSVEPEKTGTLKVTPPVVWLPEYEISNSPGNPLYVQEGPFKGQLLFGDVHYGGIQRVFFEKVGHEYQGCAFKFTQGLEGGVNRLCSGPDGCIYVGCLGSNGNWGQYGKHLYGLQKLKYNGGHAFEMQAVRAKSNGMEIEFTEALNAATTLTAPDFHVETWKYLPTPQYGGAKEDLVEILPASLTLSPDRRRVFLELPPLTEGNVVYIRLNHATFRSQTGELLWSTEAWYTLNRIPADSSKLPATPGLAPPPLPKNLFNSIAPDSSAALKKGSRHNKAGNPKPEGKTGKHHKTPDHGKKLGSESVPGTHAVPAKPNTAAANTPVAAETLSEAEVLAQGAALIERSGCRSCHGITGKITGPAYSDVATRYRNRPDALKTLTDKVLKGGSGSWGTEAMAPQYHVTRPAASKMVQYILSLKQP